jgi:hypothetical protein
MPTTVTRLEAVLSATELREKHSALRKIENQKAAPIEPLVG